MWQRGARESFCCSFHPTNEPVTAQAATTWPQSSQGRYKICGPQASSGDASHLSSINLLHHKCGQRHELTLDHGGCGWRRSQNRRRSADIRSTENAATTKGSLLPVWCDISLISQVGVSIWITLSGALCLFNAFDSQRSHVPIRRAHAKIHAPVAPVLACGTKSLSKVYKQGGIRRRPLCESRRSEMHYT